MDSKKKDIITILVWLILFFLLLVPIGCSGNWVIGGWEVNPSDSVFVKIIDQDSVLHHFKPPIMEGSSNWCYEHTIWEDVRKSEQ